MKTIYLDCFAGISGNMMLGALIDAGLPEDILKSELKKLPIDGYDIDVTRVTKCGISATYVDVTLHHEHHHHEQDHHHRHLPDIYKIIENATLNAAVKDNSKKVFQLLAEAEAKVHGTEVDKIHFHEVGAVDAIIDIVGTVFGLDYLGIEKVYTSKIQTGYGFVECNHGKMPVPAPATAELLKNIPHYFGHVEKELVTPTGAALVAALSAGQGEKPQNFISETIGYGAGTWDLDIPNVLRLHLGELTELDNSNDILVIEANIDDLNPQFYNYVMDNLFAQGALDVWLTPITMKKNRPATLISMLIPRERFEDISKVLFTETSTIGFRYYKTERKIADRSIQPVVTPWGEINVKISSVAGKICNVAPEYDDCCKVAHKSEVPLKKVHQMALMLAQNK